MQILSSLTNTTQKGDYTTLNGSVCFIIITEKAKTLNGPACEVKAALLKKALSQ